MPPPRSALLFTPASDEEYVHFENSNMHPFESEANEFSRVNAWWLADAALLAYWNEAGAARRWSHAGLRFEFLSREGVQCHLAWSDTFAIVAFRGTQPDDLRDLIDDAGVVPARWVNGGDVYRGFLDAHERIWRLLEPKIKDLAATRSIWLTGHSLGGALATLTMDRLGKGAARGLYTIGSPPVGNRQFTAGFNERHAGRCFRYVNGSDIVARVPKIVQVGLGGYVHVQERRFIDANGVVSGGSSSVDASSVLRLTALRVGLLIRGDAFGLLRLPELIDHTPRRYAVRIWNDYDSHPQPARAG
jgi:triacylglycerol lipase